MFYGRVVGTVWATRKDPAIEGMSLMLVQRVRLDGSPEGTPLVAVDSVSAGIGDPVLVAQGSSARQTELTRDRPVDAVIMAIIEGFDAPNGVNDDA